MDQMFCFQKLKNQKANYQNYKNLELKNLKNTESRQRFIEAKGYDVEDYFMDNLSEMNLYTSLKIATFIEKNLQSIQVTKLRSVVLGGCIVHTIGEPITFVIEMVRKQNYYTTLTDVQLIDMDEYLDLMLLDCYIKTPKKLG